MPTFNVCYDHNKLCYDYFVCRDIWTHRVRLLFISNLPPPANTNTHWPFYRPEVLTKHIPCGLCSAELHKLHTHEHAYIHEHKGSLTQSLVSASTLDCMNVPSRWVYWQANLLQLWISLFQILAVCALDSPFLASWGLPEGSGSQGSQGAHEDLESAGKHWKATAYWLARAVSPVLHHGLSNCCLCVFLCVCVLVFSTDLNSSIPN